MRQDLRVDSGWSSGPRILGLDHFKFVVFQDPNFNNQKFNFDTDIVRAEEIDRGIGAALFAGTEIIKMQKP